MHTPSHTILAAVNVEVRDVTDGLWLAPATPGRAEERQRQPARGFMTTVSSVNLPSSSTTRTVTVTCLVSENT